MSQITVESAMNIILSCRKRKRTKKSRRFVHCSVHYILHIHNYILRLHIHHKVTCYMITMNNNDRFNCYCQLSWLLLLVVNATIINGFVNDESTKSTAVFFRWSAGFGRNFQEFRCATDQSSADPSNHLVDVYPEMQSSY
jgi:hypothetical protein